MKHEAKVIQLSRQEAIDEKQVRLKSVEMDMQSIIEKIERNIKKYRLELNQSSIE